MTDINNIDRKLDETKNTVQSTLAKVDKAIEGIDQERAVVDKTVRLLGLNTNSTYATLGIVIVSTLLSFYSIFSSNDKLDKIKDTINKIPTEPVQVQVKAKQ